MNITESMRNIVLEMVEIMNDQRATEDDRSMAYSTIVEILRDGPRPERGSIITAIRAIREAGGKDWDKIEDPMDFLGR